MLRKTLISIATVSISLAGLATVQAADLPVRKAPPIMAAPAFNWSGFYIGLHAGVGGDEHEYPFTSPLLGGIAGQLSLTNSGGFAGGQIGYNWQGVGSPWVFGIEADVAWSGITGEVAATAGPLSVSAGTDVDWFGTARVRLGYAWDRFMLYGTGGVAYGETTTFLNAAAVGLAAFTFSQSTDKLGWTAGGGFEYALAPNISVKTEYLFIDLGRDTVFASPLFTIAEETTLHTIKAGVNWRFGHSRL